PGVGTARRAVVARLDNGSLVVAPDNGVLTVLLGRQQRPEVRDLGERAEEHTPGRPLHEHGRTTIVVLPERVQLLAPAGRVRIVRVVRVRTARVLVAQEIDVRTAGGLVPERRRDREGARRVDGDGESVVGPVPVRERAVGAGLERRADRCRLRGGMEAGGRNAIVFEDAVVAHEVEPGALAVHAVDRLPHLEIPIVEQRGRRVVVASGLVNQRVVRVAHLDLHPHATPLRIPGGQLVSGAVDHLHPHLVRVPGHRARGRGESQVGALILQLIEREVDRPFEVRLAEQRRAVLSLEHGRDPRVRSGELVQREVGARLRNEEAGATFHGTHVAGLALGPLGRERALLPFVVRRLFRELEAGVVAVLIEQRDQRVREVVAHGAHLGGSVVRRELPRMRRLGVVVRTPVRRILLRRAVVHPVLAVLAERGSFRPLVHSMAEVALDAVEVAAREPDGSDHRAAVRRAAASLEPGLRRVATEAELAHSGHVLVRDVQGRPEDRIASGVRHHRAGPRLPRFIVRFEIELSVTGLTEVRREESPVLEIARLRAGKDHLGRGGAGEGEQRDARNGEAPDPTERRGAEHGMGPPGHRTRLPAS
ncbi:MAG: SAM-dependent chlorinase/fluorinase, partial [Gemmatimonadetes bacterium]|nr:SAM-dependent chlorinase/fluorinase [Gemmatimonadota bacterium]